MTSTIGQQVGSGLVHAESLVIVGPSLVFGTPVADLMVGHTFADALSGLGGNDTIKGLGGYDELFGDNGADSLYGGNGADLLYGGNGADRLFGDKGNDEMVGGAGADQFVIRAGTGTDHITDFQDGIDQIRIEASQNINIAINYSGPDATITIAELGVVIVLDDVGNNFLQLTHTGNTFFLT